MRTVFVLGLLASFTAAADDAGDRAKLTGQWTLQSDVQAEQGAIWTIENKGDSVHLTIAKGDRQVSDFNCNLVGRDCDVQDAGKPVKVSFYFNGPKLVEMETRGSEVVKRRFSASGKELQVEVIPVVPGGKTETLRFKRAEAPLAGR